MIINAHWQQKNGGDPTEQWIQARTGCVTASEFGDIVDLSGKLRTGEMPRTYIAEKIFERWTGRKKPSNFFTVEVNNGVIVEEKAAAFASLEYGLEIQHVGFISNDDGTVGASPDGLIGWDGLKLDQPTKLPACFKPTANVTGIEIKCPSLTTHIKWLMDGGLPKEHIAQVQGSMWMTGCQSWHFLSYPLACYLDGFPPIHLVVERDEAWQANFSESIVKFMSKLDTEFAKIVEKNGGPPPRFAQKSYTINPENYSEKTGDIAP